MRKIVLTIRLLGDRSGGAERLYCELANKLVQNGYEVFCLVYESGDHRPFYELSPKVNLINLFVKFKNRTLIGKCSGALESTKGKVGYLAEFLSRNYDYYMQLRRFLKSNSIDVCISLLPPANTVAVLACKGLETKSIACNHNVPKQDYENPERWSANPLDISLRRKIVKKADAIHVLFDEFGKWFGDDVQHKLVTINNYVPDDFFTTTQAKYESRDNLILGVGRLSPVKNYEVLLKAWAKIHNKHPEWRVEIYGVGPQLKFLRSMAKELGVAESFKLRGHTKNIKNEYDHAKILCHPAHYEGFGLSVAEALARRLPVVAYQDCEGVNQFVSDKENGLMVERDVDGDTIANALDQLIRDQDFAKKLSGNAEKSVLNFSSEIYYGSWFELIRKLA